MMKMKWNECVLLIGFLVPISAVGQSTFDPVPTAVAKSFEIKLDVAGLEAKPLFRADEVTVPDDYHVTGVVVKREARAYLEAGMSQPASHVAYDRVGGAEIAVTFCDQTGCTRVFVGKEKAIRSIRVRGWKDHNMQLLVDGVQHPHDSREIKLQELNFRTITWGEWKRLHPRTKIYLGDRADQFVDRDLSNEEEGTQGWW